RPQLERGFAGPVPGAQLGPQYPADQRVILEAGPLIVDWHQEQVRGLNGTQQRRRIRPAGDGSARIHGQNPENRRVQHELSHLGRLLIEDLETKYSAIAWPRTSSTRS